MSDTTAGAPPTTAPVHEAGRLRRAAGVTWRAVAEFGRHVVVEPVREGRLRDVDWPFGLRPIVVVGVVGYVAAAVLVLLSGWLREWIPLTAQSGAATLTLPRAIIWVVLALTALSMTLAVCGALHARAWFRWLTTAFIALVMLFISVPDQSAVPLARLFTVLACAGLVVFVAVRGGRGFAWYDFAIVTVVVWSPLAVTAAVLTALNRPFGYDFLPLLLSLMLTTLGQLAIPAAIAAGAAVASITVSSALWAARIVRTAVGARAVLVALVLVAVWRTVDAVLMARSVVGDADRMTAVVGAVLLLALIAAVWAVLARVRPERGTPTAQGMADRIDAVALIVAAFTTTSLAATPLIVLSQVLLGFGVPREVPTVLLAVATSFTGTVFVYVLRGVGALVLIALAIVQARRGRRTLPELMAALGVAGAMLAAAVLFRFPFMWDEDALAITGTVLALGTLLVALVRRRLGPARSTAALVALLMSALFAYREIVTDPVAFLLGFAGGAVVLFGFVWSFLTGYRAANEDSPAYPRSARVQLVLANALFGITVLVFLALARDPEASVALGDLAAYGGQAFGDPLVASGLLLALWAAVRGHELDDERDARRPVASSEANPSQGH